MIGGFNAIIEEQKEESGEEFDIKKETAIARSAKEVSFILSDRSPSPGRFRQHRYF